MTKIIGIDPGTRGAGFCIIEDGSLVDSTQVNINEKLDLYDRMRFFQEACKGYLVKADFYAIEMPWMGRNAAVAMKLSHIRGVAIAEIYNVDPGARIIDITPLAVRKFLGLPMGAKKKEIHEQLKQMCGDKAGDAFELKKQEDRLDSIGVAYTAYSKYFGDFIKIRK